LKWIAGAFSTFWTGAPQSMQAVSGSSLIRCITSNRCPFSQRYS
jgi:hypothetical protein